MLLRTLDSPNETANGRFGTSVAGVPDVDGDGYGDVIVGAPGEPSPLGTLQAGRAYLFSGATGQLLLTLNSPVPVPAGNFGNSVGATRDATGDGRGDLLVGAPREELTPALNDSGRAYLFNGATGAIVHQWAGPNPGLLGSGNFGASIAGIGDVNGDLRSDVIIGAPNEEIAPSPNNSGLAYIFDGATGAQLFVMAPPATFIGGKFGVAVASMPDITGDGIPDAVIGEEFGAGGTGPLPGGPGRAYAYNPATGLLIQTYASPAPIGLGRFGVSVGGSPDFTFDGRGDVIVGAPAEVTGLIASGRAASFNGASGAVVTSYPAQNPVLSGLFGRSVDGLADLDGDLAGDIIVGAPGEAPNASPVGAGRAYVFTGATGGSLGSIPVVPTPTTCFVDPIGDVAGYQVGGGWGQVPYLNPARGRSRDRHGEVLHHGDVRQHHFRH